MKKYIVLMGILLLSVGAVVCGQDMAGHAADMKHIVAKPDGIKWGPAPPGLPPGAQAAVLFGDLAKPGPFVARAKLPDGYRIPAHWHSIDENITVLKGTFLIGDGEKLDPAKMEELPVGSFMSMPKGMRHFGAVKGETIIQIHGNGPFDITYVNPADDPRKNENKK